VGVDIQRRGNTAMSQSFLNYPWMRSRF
jgi:hypothetical protein